MFNKKEQGRKKRQRRIRKKILGTSERPRISVYRSLTNIYVQLIDDLNHRTLLSVSSLDKDFKKRLKYSGNIEAAKVLGKTLAKEAKTRGFTKLVFDRSGYLYHGRIKALAEAAREEGLKF